MVQKADHEAFGAHDSDFVAINRAGFAACAPGGSQVEQHDSQLQLGGVHPYEAGNQAGAATGLGRRHQKLQSRRR